MGRKRNNNDAWMPPRVYRGRSAYEFKPPSGGAIRLCDLDVPQSVVWAKYEEILSEKKQKSTFNALVESFINSGDFQELAIETKKDYRKYANKVLPVFGKMNPDNIKPEHIRQYMDRRGINSRTQANREKSFLSRVFRWGYERGLVKMNPCQGVRQFKEKARDRYVTDSEYNALYSVSPDIVKIAMEIAFLCCARQADILSMVKSQIVDQGLLITQSKTAVSQVKLWSPRLVAAMSLAENLPLKHGVSAIYVLHQDNGARYTRDGFNSKWMKAKKDAKLAYPDVDFNFTFHDLKAKGISDLTGSLYEKQSISGHKNVSQTARYDRKIKTVPTVDGQNIMK